MTEPQIEEAATMRCECEKALEYQESANRRTVAKQRVNELFGEGAGEYKQPDAVQTIILNTVDAICDKKNESCRCDDPDGASLPDHADGERQNKSRARNIR